MSTVGITGQNFAAPSINIITVNAKDKIYNERTFDDEQLNCPKCGWNGKGEQAHVAGFYGIGKFKEVLCPNCSEYLGNILRDRSNGENRFESQTGPI